MHKFLMHSFLVSAITLDKILFSAEKCGYFCYFSMKTYVVGTHWKCLGEALLMSTTTYVSLEI